MCITYVYVHVYTYMYILHVHVCVCMCVYINTYKSCFKLVMHVHIHENHNSLGRKWPLSLGVKQSPTAQDAFRPIAGLISRAGVTGSVGITRYACATQMYTCTCTCIHCTLLYTCTYMYSCHCPPQVRGEWWAVWREGRQASQVSRHIRSKQIAGTLQVHVHVHMQYMYK